MNVTKVVLLFLLNSGIILMQVQDSVISEYFKLADEAYLKNKEKRSVDEFEFINWEKEKIKKIFNQIYGEKYLSFSIALYENQLYLREKIKSAKLNKKNLSKEEINNNNYAYKISFLEQYIQQEFGEVYKNIRKNEFILRVKIIEAWNNNSYDNSTKHNIPSKQYKCQIENVLIGDWKFRKGQTLEINHVIMEESTILLKENSYLLSIREWLILNEDPKFVITNFKGTPNEYFLIKDKYIHMPNNYFQFGDILEWDKFRTKFTEIYK